MCLPELECAWACVNTWPELLEVWLAVLCHIQLICQFKSCNEFFHFQNITVYKLLPQTAITTTRYKYVFKAGTVMHTVKKLLEY